MASDELNFKIQGAAMARHLVQNAQYTYIANTDAARTAILQSGLFGVHEITNDEFNHQLNDIGTTPCFSQSENFDALVWSRNE